jgi:hypothetical protein
MPTINFVSSCVSELLHRYIQKEWYKRAKCVLTTPLINTEKVYFYSLPIKLGLIKNFDKARDKNTAVFMYLKNKFPMISDAKIKEGVFGGPQIRELTPTYLLNGAEFFLRSRPVLS